MPRRRKKKRSQSAPAVLHNKGGRPYTKRKQWTDKSMEAALEAVRKGSISANKAALLHGVPPSTLKDRLSGRVAHGSKPGPAKYLNNEEEHALADHLVQAAESGYGKTRKQVKSIVENVAREKNLLRSERVSDGWWRRFMERQPQLSLRRGDSTAHIRMNSVNRESMESYFNLLEDTLSEHDLMNHPAQIYNMDESGMPLDARPPNVIAKRGQKKVRYRQAGKKEQISVIACANAVGQSIPPMVIFEGKYLNLQWTVGEVPGTYYGMSDKGWTDQELFKHWLMDHFLKYAVPSRPLLVLLDGHSSHYEPMSIELARKEGVIIFCLPPHTTQDSQPLDCTVFGPLKRHWSEVCHEFQQKHPGVVISKLNFSGLFAKAWLQALTPANIVAGFRTCGVYPFNRNAISYPDDDNSGTSCNTSGDVSSVVEPSTSNSCTPTFTPEQIELFETRFKEGYNIYSDKDYVAWLELNHPEAAPSVDTATSLLDSFSHVTPASPLLFSDPSGSDSSVVSASHVSPVSSSASLSPSCNVVSTSSSIPPSTATPISVSTPLSVVSPSNSASSGGSHLSSARISPIDKYLHVQMGTPVRSKPSVRSSSTRAITGARVLTSSECLAIIKEKEMKKKLEQEEKEKRKIEREEKKKKREEEKQKKAEEKMRKAAEKAEKAKEKEEEKARKAEERAKKQAANKRGRNTRSRQESSSTGESGSGVGENVDGESGGGPSSSTSTQKKRRASSSLQVASKRQCLEETDSDDKCCVCFRSFEEDVSLETGAEWLQCSCTRWLHEDCILDCIIDSSGQEKLCPHCCA